MEERFITFDTVRKELEKMHFFGFTVKREKEHKNRIEYTFRSVWWYTITYTVKVLKLGELGKSDKIVIGIISNGEEINGLEELFNSFKELGKKHNILKKNEFKDYTQRN